MRCFRVERCNPGGRAGEQPLLQRRRQGLGAGVQLQATEPTRLQFGISYDSNPVPASRRLPDIPVGDVLRFALGAGHDFNEHVNISTGYTLGWMRGNKVDDVELPSGVVLNGKYEDDIYILYTGGTTGMPKGVMWRHEDLFFAALMGGNPYGAPPERPEQVGENAAAGQVFTALPAAPLMHGAAQWAAMIYLFSGGKVVLTPGTGFDAEKIWKLVETEKVQSMAIVGDAMGRPLADALGKPGASYDTSSLIVIGSGGATYSEGVKAQIKEHLPNILLMDSFGGSEGGNAGPGCRG